MHTSTDSPKTKPSKASPIACRANEFVNHPSFRCACRSCLHVAGTLQRRQKSTCALYTHLNTSSCRSSLLSHYTLHVRFLFLSLVSLAMTTTTCTHIDPLTNLLGAAAYGSEITSCTIYSHCSLCFDAIAMLYATYPSCFTHQLSKLSDTPCIKQRIRKYIVVVVFVVNAITATCFFNSTPNTLETQHKTRTLPNCTMYPTSTTTTQHPSLSSRFPFASSQFVN